MEARPHRAVIIACTAAKHSEPAAAGLLYTGATWHAWRKHGPEDMAMPFGWSLWALSGLHGLLSCAELVAPYDYRLTKERASALCAVAPSWLGRIQERARMESRGGEYADRIEAVVIGGAEYQRVARCMGVAVVRAIDGGGGGIGLLRQRTKHWAAHVKTAMNGCPWADDAWPRAEPRVELCVEERQLSLWAV